MTNEGKQNPQEPPNRGDENDSAANDHALVQSGWRVEYEQPTQSQTEIAQLESKIPLKNPDVREFPLLDDLILYYSTHEKAYSFNSSARMLWETCDGEHNVTEVIEILCERVNCDADEMRIVLEDDVKKTLTLLFDLKLISFK